MDYEDFTDIFAPISSEMIKSFLTEAHIFVEQRFHSYFYLFLK